MPMEQLTPDLPLSEYFSAEYLEYYGILPLSLSDGTLTLAAVEPPAREVLIDLESLFQATTRIELVDRPTLEAAIRRAYASEDSVDALLRTLDTSLSTAGPLADGPIDADVRDLANQPPVVRYVNLLLREAHEARASDVHIEATNRGLRVRYRIDGVLTPIQGPPPTIHSAVISRVKLIAELDIAERRLPQDGRTRLVLEDRELDLRVSTMPTLFGESLVLRLLDHGGRPSTLAGLGMDSELRDIFSGMAKRANGIILATGPTGSGKTSTLYAALQLRDGEREKIITIENPVEFQLPHVTQVPVNSKGGMTFASGLRTLLRQDPDVVMVGEMRDPETARVAVQAALTGHLVLSTVHTNSAASAIVRLIDLGIEPYLVAGTLQGVLAQRLVRTVCTHCAKPTTQSAAQPADAAFAGPSAGEGCALCRQSGYLGRVGIFELLDMDEELRSAVHRSPDTSSLHRMAVAQGMTPLVEAGRAKVRDGLTTSEEVARVVHD